MKIVGVAYPIPKRFVNRFFEGGKNVFVKPATTWKQLEPGMKLYIYQSHEDTGIVGEATIKKITLERDPMKFYERFGDRLFLTREELVEYVKSQARWGSKNKKKKPWIAIELENFRRYRRPVKPKRFISVGGQYIKEETK